MACAVVTAMVSLVSACQTRFSNELRSAGTDNTPALRSPFPEDIRSVVFDAARTKGGRGDTAPAYLAAREFRFRGFQGAVTLDVSDPQGDRILSLLSTDYLQKSVQAPDARRLMIEDNIEVVRSYLKPGQASETPAPDLAFAFALRPSEIREPTSILGARISVLLGVFNLRQIATSNGQRNRMIIEGKIYDLPDAGLGANDLGHYSNVFVSEMSSLSLKQKQLSLLTRLAADNAVYESVKLKRPDVVPLLRRNKRLTDFFRTLITEGYATPSAQTMSSSIQTSVGYGLGLSSVWSQFFDYLNAAQSLLLDSSCQPKPGGRSLVMFYPTVFEDDTQRNFMTSAAKALRCPDAFQLVNLTAESLSWQTPPGSFQLVMTGNLPHESFTYLLATAQFPAIVSGDNSVSDAINLGLPFVMTTVEWNKFSQRGVGDFINETAQAVSLQPEFTLSLSKVFDSNTPSYLSRSFLYEKYPEQTQRLFAEMRSRSERSTMLDSVLDIIAMARSRPERNDFFEGHKNPLYQRQDGTTGLLHPKTSLDFELVNLAAPLEKRPPQGSAASPVGFLSGSARYDLEVKVLADQLTTRRGEKLKGYYQYVLMADGRLFATKERIKHHILANRAPVAAAGEFSITNGSVNSCNGFSKSYPNQSQQQLRQLPARLKELGHRTNLSSCEPQ